MTRRPPLAALLVALLSGWSTTAGAEDLRLRLVQLELRGQSTAALRLAEQELRRDEAAARTLGLDYLRAHLLEVAGRTDEAARAFAAALGGSPDLAPYARLRLAAVNARLGHPEVAAGLLATLLGRDPPPPLVRPAVASLRASIAGGGDCRVLGGIDARRFAALERRRLELALAECDLRGGDAAKAMHRLVQLLDDDATDDVALEAAERVAALPADQAGGRVALLLGMAFHHNRDFARSSGFLEPELRRMGGLALAGPSGYEARYALARNHFWTGQYRAAALAFEELAQTSSEPAQRGQALYQSGRSLELLGEWSAASATFARAFQVDPSGENAPFALFAALRIEWRSGHEPAALGFMDQLGRERRWRQVAARAALFLVASDLIRGRADRAETWLERAVSGAADADEVAYWRGRLEELRGRPDAAAHAYAEALAARPYGLLAHAARQRLRTEPLASAAKLLGERLAASRRPEDLLAAWLLLGDDSARGEAARQTLSKVLESDPKARPFLFLTVVPAERWPLWSETLRSPEERFLALGLWHEGATALLKHFPLSSPGLGFTAVRLLGDAGETRRSLDAALALAQRAPRGLPRMLLPVEFRRALDPYPFRATIEAESRRWGIDAQLLAALLREESGFDPRARSASAAHGLAQFVLPTARELGSRIGYVKITVADLERPEVSIALGAAYLAELERRLHDSAEAVAAYNAGEPQAVLWRAYCYSREPEEFFTKVNFQETRGYIADVLAGRDQYAELYGRRR